jgi:hypothetical protein
MMAEIIPIDLEFGMVVHVYELVHHGVLHMAFAKESALAEQDCTSLRAEASRPREVAGKALYVLRRHGRTLQAEMFQHEHNSRAFDSNNEDDCL